MSTWLLSEVWQLRMPAGPKAVMLSCADQANDHGMLPRPSMAALRLRTGLAANEVRSAFGWLEQSGLLRRAYNPETGLDAQVWLHLLPSDTAARVAEVVPRRRRRLVR